MTPLQIIFIVYSSFALILISYLFFYATFKKWRRKKKYKNIYAKKLYSLSLVKDYLLVNQFRCKESGYDEVLCDHILFGDKYIYLIYDYYFNGAISGECQDKKLLYYEYKKQVKEIVNPYAECTNKIRIIQNVLYNENPEIFRGIIIINKECNVNINGKFNKIVITNEKNLKKLINKFETENVKNLVKEDVDLIAQKMYNARENVNKNGRTVKKDN